MRISVSSLRSRSLRVLLLAGLALPLAVSNVSAATMTGQTGSIGHVTFSDTATSPGARCTYQGAAGTLYFSGVSVKGPKVQWPDQNSGVVEHGWVAFRIQIQHFDGTSWSVVKQGSVTKLAASDNQWTTFPAKTLSWGGPNNHVYRAGVTLKFINTNGTTKGHATYFIDNHRRLYDNAVVASCVGRHSNVG